MQNAALSVMLVEDDEVIRINIAHILRLMGCTVLSAEDGLKGLELFLKTKFDLVLTDYDMPKMNGMDLATCIKEMTSDTPVVLMTGQPKETISAKLRDHTVDFALQKPFGIDEIKHAINRIYEQ